MLFEFMPAHFGGNIAVEADGALLLARSLQVPSERIVVVKPVPALEKATKVMQTLASQPETPMTLSELAKRTATSPSTCHSIVIALCESGLLLRHPRSKTYSLGPAIVELGSAAARGYLGLTAARDRIVELSRLLRLSIVVGARDDDELIIVAHHEHEWDLGASRTGFRSPLVPPLGVLFYAWADEVQIEEWLSRGARVTSSSGIGPFRSALERVRNAGYWASLGGTMQDLTMRVAVRLADEQDPEVRLRLAAELLTAIDTNGGFVAGGLAETGGQDMVGGPVFGPAGNVVLTVTAVGSPGRVQKAGMRAVAHAVLETCSVVTKSIGGSSPVGWPPLVAEARRQ
jgi:DNA-binding IclR family transcriptional regulator